MTKYTENPSEKECSLLLHCCSEGDLLPCIGNLVYIILLVIKFSYDKYHSVFVITINRWKQNRKLGATTTDIKV